MKLNFYARNVMVLDIESISDFMVKIHLLEHDAHYSCNKACNTTQAKSTMIKSKVTCMNCLHQIKKALKK